MRAKILWIEGKRVDNPPFIPHLRKKGFSVEVVKTGEEGLEFLSVIDPDLIVVNSASMRSSGKRICRSLRERADGVPVLLINAAGKSDLPNCADVVLTLPFTSRKLINRINPLLPGEGKNMLHIGPIRLDLEKKRVRCQGRETTLTPRLVHLLRIFMLHEGEALERKRLFSEVWNTEYTGDTRTLDVHISWLRQAIEEDPRNPHFLKTIRGLGYRLDA